jgi:hypothetical protein
MSEKQRTNAFARAGSTCAGCARYVPHPEWEWSTLSEEAVSADGQTKTLTQRRVELPQNAGCGLCSDRPPSRYWYGFVGNRGTSYPAKATDLACCYYRRKRDEEASK